MSDAPSPLMVDIGRRLRQARKNCGWSLDQAAKVAANTEGPTYSASALGAYERGFRHPSLPTLFDLADLYGVTVSWLLDLKESEQPPVITADSAYVLAAAQAFVTTVTGDQT